MKKFILLIMLTMIIPLTGRADDTVKKQIKSDLVKQFKVGNYQLGKKYILAIPPNETASFGWADSAMEIYVSSQSDAVVEIDVLGKVTTHQINAHDVLIINDSYGLTKTACEIREPYLASNKTISIESDVPVSVYVMNSKSTTSDGYMAIPVEHWDKEYLHCSYYDNYESSTNKFAGGFLVLGSKNNTKVDVELRGVGKGIGTIKGTTKTVGDDLTFDINEGEVFQVETDGLTRGEFDISGSKITANKPIGLISYHWRAVLPIFMASSRDHLSEMIPATKTLSTEYASVCLERGGSEKGDLFRLVSVEDNTNYMVKWYDLETKQIINSKHGVLTNAGDFTEISSTLTADASTTSITGSSVFTADKPFMLMQYSYSSGWDGATYDPFMWVVTPTDQYVTHAIVQTPSNKSFAENYINIIAKHDPTDVNKVGLKSLSIDDVYITDVSPAFTSNQIPGTNLFWARLPVATGPHIITGNGNVTFGAYIYGFKSVDSYGWPAALASKPMDEIDSLPPVITYDNKTSNSGTWKIRIQENQNNTDGEISEVDSKVWFEPITLIEDKYGLKSTNFKTPHIDFEWEYDGHDDYEVTLEVDNMYQYAEANFFVADYAGNIALEQIKYYPNLMTLEDDAILDFGAIPINNSKQNVLNLINSSDVKYNIKSIELEGSEAFSVVTESTPNELNVSHSILLEIKYNPTDISDHDEAVLRIKTDNIIHEWTLTGSAFSDEEILAFDNSGGIDFGKVMIGHLAASTIKISNKGSVDINIESISMVDGSNFYVDNSANGTVLEAGESLEFDATFAPKDLTGKRIDTVLIKTSKDTYTYQLEGTADSDNSISEITGDDLITISPNPIQSDANITINIPVAANLKANLYSSEGQFVKSLYNGMCNKGEKSLEFNSSGIASGTYTLIIELGNKKFASQIVISK